MTLFELVDKYTTYKNIEEFMQEIEKHKKYRTCVIVQSQGEVIAFCRWNMLSNDTANLLDLVIHENYRRQGLIEEIAIIGVKTFPELKYLVFERGYDDGKQIKEPHKISIERLLKRRTHDSKCLR